MCMYPATPCIVSTSKTQRDPGIAKPKSLQCPERNLHEVVRSSSFNHFSLSFEYQRTAIPRISSSLNSCNPHKEAHRHSEQEKEDDESCLSTTPLCCLSPISYYCSRSIPTSEVCMHSHSEAASLPNSNEKHNVHAVGMHSLCR